MKKVLCILVSAVMLLSALAFAEMAPAQTVEETTEQKLERMIPVLDSFARNMGIEGETTYSALDADFVWSQLYLMGVNWTDVAQDSADSDIVLSSDTLRAYAAASFSGMVELPALPEDFNAVSYDETLDAYTLALSDAGETYIVIERYAEDADGNLIVGFGLYGSPNLRVYGLTATLTTPLPTLNPESEEEEPLAFPYAVTDVRAEGEMDYDGLTPVSCAIRYVEPAVPETPAETTSQYAKLSEGSHGDAVVALQNRLNALGYDCGKADGIFGSKTRAAVRYFQDALGVSQNGIADAALQERLFASNAPEYVEYVQLKSGSNGIRVERLQARLRKLGYLAEPVDSDFGSRTEDAVKLFQKTAKLKQDGIAGVNTLKALYKSNAPKCKTYISLRKGDTGSRVTEMQNQLKKLGLLSKASGTYDSKTVAAVKAFMETVGVSGNGSKASASLIKQMFEYVAPTVAPTEAPTTEPTDEPTTEPTDEPTGEPTDAPTGEPTDAPTGEPTDAPSGEPTGAPSGEPTDAPSGEPTDAPADKCVLSDEQLASVVSLIQGKVSSASDATSAVSWLQNRLNVTVNGVYDAATKQAVAEYQEAQGLTNTNGILDSTTLNLMFA